MSEGVKFQRLKIYNVNFEFSIGIKRTYILIYVSGFSSKLHYR